LQLTARSPDWTTEETLKIEGADLHEALQYTATAGIPRLLEWMTGLQEIAHGRKKGEGWRVSLGSGSQDAIYKVGDHAILPIIL
jgi:tryptophan aminotransferase